MTLPVIAPMTQEDLGAVMDLEHRCFRDPWTRHMYLSDLADNALATYLVVRPHPDSNPAGTPPTLPPLLAYGGFWMFVDEAHIATIASHPDLRGCGLGLWLMLGFLDKAIARGATVATLEVRVSNLPAQRLYERVGFQVVGKRVHYYRDGEDGLIMTTLPLSCREAQTRLTAAREDAISRLRDCLPSQG